MAVDSYRPAPLAFRSLLSASRAIGFGRAAVQTRLMTCYETPAPNTWCHPQVLGHLQSTQGSLYNTVAALGPIFFG